MVKLMDVACKTAQFIDWLYFRLCWQLLNCSHLLCFALNPNKSPNGICWHSHTVPCHSADWYRGNAWVFLKVSYCCVHAAVGSRTTCSVPASAAAQRSVNCFLYKMSWTEIFDDFISQSAASRLHQGTVSHSVRIQYNLAFGCRLNAIYCCSALFKWPASLKAGTAVSFPLHGKPVTTTRHHLTAEDSSL